MLSEIWSVVLTQAFFQAEVVSEHASSWTLTRNCCLWRTGTMCVWRDLSRLVDVE